MPNPFCLLPHHADEFLDRIKSGALSADGLARMTSAERRAAFAEFMGDKNAEQVNASFESRLLLKNQQKALKTWIESAKNITPAARRELLSRVERMDPKLLQPGNVDAFLADLAKQRLGFGVTAEEAAKITTLSREATDAKKAGDWERYMDARVAFREYTAGLQGHGKMTVPKGIA